MEEEDVDAADVDVDGSAEDEAVVIVGCLNVVCCCRVVVNDDKCAFPFSFLVSPSSARVGVVEEVRKEELSDDKC